MMADSPQAYYDAQNISYPYNTPQKAIEHLKKEITKHFPALPSGIDCDIKYVDKSLEEKMSPAFYLAPCIDAYKENVIYVNRNKKYDSRKNCNAVIETSKDKLVAGCSSSVIVNGIKEIGENAFAKSGTFVYA